MYKPYKRNTSTIVLAKKLTKFKILINKHGIFFGYSGDYILSTLKHKWICEHDAFEKLYTECSPWSPTYNHKSGNKQ